jgi:hypothetical protein
MPSTPSFIGVRLWALAGACSSSAWRMIFLCRRSVTVRNSDFGATSRRLDLAMIFAPAQSALGVIIEDYGQLARSLFRGHRPSFSAASSSVTVWKREVGGGGPKVVAIWWAQPLRKFAARFRVYASEGARLDQTALRQRSVVIGSC